MPVKPTIVHFRLDTRRLIVSDQSDGDDHGIAVLQQLLGAGKYQLPHRDGWTIRSSIAESLLAAMIDDGHGPVARMWVVLDGRDLARVVRPPRVLDLPIPACVIEVLQRQARPAAGRLWSLVDAIAWAWVKHVGWAPARPSGPSRHSREQRG